MSEQPTAADDLRKKQRWVNQALEDDELTWSERSLYAYLINHHNKDTATASITQKNLAVKLWGSDSAQSMARVKRMLRSLKDKGRIAPEKVGREVHYSFPRLERIKKDAHLGEVLSLGDKKAGLLQKVDEPILQERPSLQELAGADADGVALADLAAQRRQAENLLIMATNEKARLDAEYVAVANRDASATPENVVSIRRRSGSTAS